jgi:antirestriction protein
MLTLSQTKDLIKDLDRDGLEELIDRYGEDVIEAALECDVQASDIEEAYQGHYRDDEKFAQDMAEQLGSVDKNASWPNDCIDWEKAARELMYDYCSHNGHYFRNL